MQCTVWLYTYIKCAQNTRCIRAIYMCIFINSLDDCIFSWSFSILYIYIFRVSVSFSFTRIFYSCAFFRYFHHYCYYGRRILRFTSISIIQLDVVRRWCKCISFFGWRKFCQLNWLAHVNICCLLLFSRTKVHAVKQRKVTSWWNCADKNSSWFDKAVNLRQLLRSKVTQCRLDWGGKCCMDYGDW